VGRPEDRPDRRPTDSRDQPQGGSGEPHAYLAKARPVYYTTFGDLVRIGESEKGRTVFKKLLFPRPTSFTELVKSSEQARNIVAHIIDLESGSSLIGG
jgi:hypothetical protein